jgi:glycine dehydrogenase subunit 1
MQTAELAGYNVHPAEDRKRMLEEIGIATIEDLFEPIDPEIRLKRPLNLPARLSEWELKKRLSSSAKRNQTTESMISFLGGGAYEHYIPETVQALTSRGEFLTAYTPYQPEMSQGILRALYDFQELMARILGLQSVNCSVYDGATALAESCWMACCITGRNKIVIADSLWPEHVQVLQTYLKGRQVKMISVPSDPDSGQIDPAASKQTIDEAKPAAVVIQSPNRYGVLDDIAGIQEIAKAANALTIASINPMITGCIKNPGAHAVDIACCEAQPLGLELNVGGPYLGVIATKPEHTSYLPGRIVGVCQDLKGEPAFALVKEEREQHVARNKATSHICSNQALLALRASVYLATLGEVGFRKVAEMCAAKAHYLEQRITQIDGVQRVKTGPFFNEFLLELPCITSDVLAALRELGIYGGVDFSSIESAKTNQLLVAVTEVKSKSDLDAFVDHVSQILPKLS